ncbi:MAG: ABC transporter ATP-binding protein, partial [Spirochaetaceae bacterium]|nr:ABC transporter ATP-binding protein [Spirochaetaceae bacterium]
GVHAVVDFSMQVEKSEIVGIIGPNGAGKTSVFNVVSGIYKADSGSVILDGEDITQAEQHIITHKGISRTFQNIRLFKGLSVIDNVMCAFDPVSKYSIFGSLVPTPRRFSEEKRGRKLCEGFLEIVGLQDYRDEKPENLSYGLQRRLEIARALACHPKVLLLDEPAAGLNPTEVDGLMQLILYLSDEYELAVLLIEHRLELVMGISSRIYVQNFGKNIAIGTPAQVKTCPEVIEAYLGTEE